MNKHLNNWLDKREGLPKNTSNNNIIREKAYQKKDEQEITLDTENSGHTMTFRELS